MEEEGQTLVEYALLVALISLVTITALRILGFKLATPSTPSTTPCLLSGPSPVISELGMVAALAAKTGVVRHRGMAKAVVLSVGDNTEPTSSKR